MIPISPELADQLKLLNPQQLAFLAGYAWAKSTGADVAAVSFQSQEDAAQPAPARSVRKPAMPAKWPNSCWPN